jgi:hypothetical protein
MGGRDISWLSDLCVRLRAAVLGGADGSVRRRGTVIVGYFLGGEALGARTLIGTACVLVSVVVITSARAAKPAPQVQPELAERR